MESDSKPDVCNAQTPLTSASVEQTEQGQGLAPTLVASFDGLGDGFKGPQGTAVLRNPSDNSLAVGHDHIVQLVNTKMAVFTKKGNKFDTTGKVLYGPVNTGNVFKDFGDFGDLNGGDAVVRYDQLADRWLIVMPIFRRLPFKKISFWRLDYRSEVDRHAGSSSMLFCSATGGNQVWKPAFRALISNHIGCGSCCYVTYSIR
jgi:hypothetical protein